MLSGDLTYLLPIEIEDKELIFRWKQSEELRRALGTIYPISSNEHEVWFAKKLVDTVNRMYMIVEKKTNIKVGAIGTNSFDINSRVAEIYYFIGEADNQGRGLGLDAIETFCSFLIKQLHFHKLFARVYEYNDRSARVLEKVSVCEFRCEARLKSHFYRDGKYWDVLIFSAFASYD